MKFATTRVDVFLKGMGAAINIKPKNADMTGQREII